MYKDSQLLIRILYTSSVKLNKVYRKIAKRLRPARQKLNSRRNINLKNSTRIKLLKKWSLRLSYRQFSMVLNSKYVPKKMPSINLAIHTFLPLICSSIILNGLRKSSNINLSSYMSILYIPYLYHKSSRYSF
jgi:hypothetical protein